MTLGEFSHILDVDPKWALNALAALGRPKRYSLELAQRLAVARAISDAAGVPIARAFALARRALTEHTEHEVVESRVSVPTDVQEVEFTIDVARILSSLNIRLSVLRTSFAPRQRGRRAARGRDALTVATEWGVDLTLLSDNLRKSVEQRLRQLDAMAAFARRVHRVAG